MKRNYGREIAAAGLVAILLVTLCGRRAALSGERATAAEGRLATTLVQVDELRSLREARSQIPRGAGPISDLSAQIVKSLEACSLGSDTMRSLTQRSDRSLQGTDREGELRVRTVSLSLQPVQLRALGAFLDHWRREHGEWKIVSIDLSPAVPASDGLAVRMDLARTYSTR